MQTRAIQDFSVNRNRLFGYAALGEASCSRFHTEALLLLLLFCLFSLAVNVGQVKPVGTIYSRADGSVDPHAASIFTADDETYVLTDNVTVIGADGIIVERDNIVADRASYSIQGAGTWSGILTAIKNVVNVTVQGHPIARNFGQ